MAESLKTSYLNPNQRPKKFVLDICHFVTQVYDVLNMIKYFKLKHNVDLNALSSNIIFFLVVVVIIFCRRIVLHPSAFDSRVKFLEKTRSFGGGAFNLSEGGLLETYHSSLKEDYYRGVVRRYYAPICVGQQPLGKGYWCVSSEVMHQLT